MLRRRQWILGHLWMRWRHHPRKLRARQTRPHNRCAQRHFTVDARSGACLECLCLNGDCIEYVVPPRTTRTTKASPKTTAAKPKAEAESTPEKPAFNPADNLTRMGMGRPKGATNRKKKNSANDIVWDALKDLGGKDFLVKAATKDARILTPAITKLLEKGLDENQQITAHEEWLTRVEEAQKKRTHKALTMAHPYLNKLRIQLGLAEGTGSAKIITAALDAFEGGSLKIVEATE